MAALRARLCHLKTISTEAVRGKPSLKLWSEGGTPQGLCSQQRRRQDHGTGAPWAELAVHLTTCYSSADSNSCNESQVRAHKTTWLHILEGLGAWKQSQQLTARLINHLSYKKCYYVLLQSSWPLPVITLQGEIEQIIAECLFFFFCIDVSADC